jgi:hypothetical protein
MAALILAFIVFQVRILPDIGGICALCQNGISCRGETLKLKLGSPTVWCYLIDVRLGKTA